MPDRKLDDSSPADSELDTICTRFLSFDPNLILSSLSKAGRNAIKDVIQSVEASTDAGGSQDAPGAKGPEPRRKRRVLRASESLLRAIKAAKRLETQIRANFVIGIGLKVLTPSSNEFNNLIPQVAEFVQWYREKMTARLDLASWRVPLKQPQSGSLASRFFNRNLPTLLQCLSEVEEETHASLKRPLELHISELFTQSLVGEELNLHIFVAITHGWLIRKTLLG